MFYKSTRNSSIRVESAAAIAKGISEEGGLFVPETIPSISMDELKSLAGMNYAQRAAFVFSKYLTDYTDAELRYCTESAYTTKAFDTENIAEIAHLFEGTYMLELWHGPTCAFKDMALQILPYFLTTAVKKLHMDKKVVILVATSGDTGKAALEGFKDVLGTEIMVFYPVEGVSDMQKRQMVTQEGENVTVCAVKGNFDDCQSGVKKIFTDHKVLEALEQGGMTFSSANSINWGRLVPQIVYYVSSYVSLAESGQIAYGDLLNVVVPTGNFGNILAAYYAKMMGVPLGKLICASNINKVLTDFIRTGVYNRNRQFYPTASPSMDILISSNLERLIYRIAGNDAEKNKALMQALNGKGAYTITDDMKKQLADFYGNYASEAETAATIKRVYESDQYIMDTHTAVAASVYDKYVKETGDTTPTVIASTASPYKFTRSVMNAIDSAYDKQSDFELVDELNKLSGVKVPQAIEDIRQAEVRHDIVCDKEDMLAEVKKFLNI